jgi:hypothetical protein
MLALSNDAVHAIRATTGSGGGEPARPGAIRLVALNAERAGTVTGLPAGDPEPGDVVVSRDGATCYLDHDLADELTDKTLHTAIANPDDTKGTLVFALVDQL